MNAEAALLDDPAEFVDTGFAAVVHLTGAAHPKPASEDGKDQRPEPGRELVIEGAVYEYVAGRTGRHDYFASFRARYRRTAAFACASVIVARFVAGCWMEPTRFLMDAPVPGGVFTEFELALVSIAAG
jgi:hypothetical protein